jgi:release factor glutamine methyltransferase
MQSSREMVRRGRDRLRAAGVEGPDREARWIWENIAGESGLDRLTGGRGPVAGAQAAMFDAAIDRRRRGEPLAHVLGEAPFRHLVVRSDRRALIPRPETEGLVDLVLERQRTGVVVDVGTGTGCIALSLAQEGEYRLVLAVERCPRALALARENITSLGLSVKLMQGDCCRGLGDSAVDVLVSNPPYLTSAEYAALPFSVKGWEPEPALESGPDGMSASRRLVSDGLRVVRPGGWMMLELDSSRAGQVAEEAVRAGWSDVSVKDDLFGRARYLVARRSGRF